MKKWIGFVRLRIRGLDIERQIKKILSLGIVMGNCKRESLTVLSFDVLPWEVKKIRKAGITVKLDARGGLTVLLYSLRKRAGLYVGLALMLCAILFLQGRVFVFEVMGNSGISESEILSIIKAEELIGNSVSGEQMERLEKQLVGEKISWASVSKNGIKLIVSVKEKPDLPDAHYKTPGDIVASKVGLITEITVLQGVAKVQEGSLVMPDDVIISGQLVYAGEPADYVAAMGKCTAKVFYNVEQEVSLSRQIKKDTGATFTSTSIMLFDREIGASTPDFENYRVSEKITSIAQIGIPIFVVERTYYEQNITTQSITCEQAMEEVKPHLLQQLEDILPVEASDISFYLDETESGVLIGVSAVTVEDIALFKAKE